jgi:RNA polymerase sigma factor (sigma-70 family)
LPNVDARSVESIYRAHGYVVLRRARRILGTEDDARDVLQEIFAAMLDNAASFRGQSSITTWLYSATTHACLNRIRNQKTREAALAKDGSGAPGGREAVAAENAESAVIVRQLLARVAEPLAEVAILYYVDEMTHQEIAMVLGCSRRHVGDLIERLHESLRDVEVVQ